MLSSILAIVFVLHSIKYATKNKQIGDSNLNKTGRLEPLLVACLAARLILLFLQSYNTFDTNITILFPTEHIKNLIHPKEHSKRRSQLSASQININ